MTMCSCTNNRFATGAASASASSFCANLIDTGAMALSAMALIISLRLIRIISIVVMGKSEYTVPTLQRA